MAGCSRRNAPFSASIRRASSRALAISASMADKGISGSANEGGSESSASPGGVKLRKAFFPLSAPRSTTRDSSGKAATSFAPRRWSFARSAGDESDSSIFGSNSPRSEILSRSLTRERSRSLTAFSSSTSLANSREASSALNPRAFARFGALQPSRAPNVRS